MIPSGVTTYVLVALLALAALVGAHEVGFRRASAVGESRLATYQADAQAKSEALQAKAARVETKVVIQYRDRVKEIRVVDPEVKREIEVIRNSGCVLPPAFRVLHDRATGAGVETPAGANEPSEVPCDLAAETILENYNRARENAEQLKALQEWAASVSTP